MAKFLGRIYPLLRATLQGLFSWFHKAKDDFTQMSQVDEDDHHSSDATTGIFELDYTSSISSHRATSSAYNGQMELCKRKSMFASCAEVMAPFDEIPAVNSLGARTHVTVP